jgi:hypothetical protein
MLSQRIHKIHSLAVEYEKYLSPGLLVFGFILDSLTLRRADVWLDNFILLSYLLISGVCIVMLNAHSAGRLQGERMQRIIPWLPLGIQFAFGGLFSGFVVLYSRSASFAASWPFLLILAGLLVGNEYLRRGYHRVELQLSIFFVAVFSYMIFAIPIALNAIGWWVFLISGIVSLVIIEGMIRIMTRFAHSAIQPHKRSVVALVITIHAVFNFLYFTNFIPPIPLALQDMIIAHNVQHADVNSFSVTYEPARWYDFFKEHNPTYHRTGTESVYAFSSIYAPANITTTVFHEWEYFDEELNTWQLASRVQYAISGGRNEGFRGFSFKTNITPGKWRVSVKTKNGQVIGRGSFTIVQSSSPAPAITIIK